MNHLSSLELWSIVHQRLAPDVDRRLRELTTESKKWDLSADEQAELKTLIKAYGAYVLRRSEAMLVLQERGYDVLAVLKVEEGEGELLPRV